MLSKEPVGYLAEGLVVEEEEVATKLVYCSILVETIRLFPMFLVILAIPETTIGTTAA